MSNSVRFLHRTLLLTVGALLSTSAFAQNTDNSRRQPNSNPNFNVITNGQRANPQPNFSLRTFGNTNFGITNFNQGNQGNANFQTRSAYNPFYSNFNYNAFDNPVHRYTSPLSPFDQYYPPKGRPSRYRNGLYGNGRVIYGWGYTIFMNGVAYYPYYCPDFIPGYSAFSPYYFYYGLAPYLGVQGLYSAPPAVVYVPVPVYSNDGQYRGWRRDDVDDYYLNRKAPDEERNKAKKEEKGEKDSNKEANPIEKSEAPTPALENLLDKAIAMVKQAWAKRDIQLLSELTDPKTRIAVYLRGKYQYSLAPQDYLDMTRDAFENVDTVAFRLDPPQRKEKGVYTVVGRHTYRSRDGEERSILISYVFEKKNDKYVLTQVGTAPEQIATLN